MKFLRYIPLLIIFSFVLSGCGRDEVSRTLDRVEQIQEEYPDSALKLLESIDADMLKPGGESEARYCLLITRAHAIDHTFDTTDSIIGKAVRYFEAEKLHGYAVESNFYRAQILLLTGDYPGAMKGALKSLEWNEKVGNRRFEAKNYDLIGGIYNDVYNHQQAASYYRKAADIFHEIGRRKNELFSRISVAQAYSQDDFMEERSIALLDSISDNPIDDDSIGLGLLHNTYIYPLSLLKRHREAYDHYRKALEYWGGVNLQESKPLVADMFINVCMYDSARHYLELERMENPDYDNDVNYHYALCNLADSLGDIPLYYEELRKMTELERGNLRGAVREEISLIERDYHRERAEKEHLRSVRNRLVYVSLTLILVIVGVFAFIIYRMRNRLRMKELQNRESEARMKGETAARLEAEARSENERLQRLEAETRSENERLQRLEAETRSENERLQRQEAEARSENERLRRIEAETRARNAELQRSEEEARKERAEAIERMEALMVETAGLKDSLSMKVDKSLRMPLNVLDSLCKDYFRLKGEKDELPEERLKNMMTTFKREVENMKSPENVAVWQAALDAANDGLLSKMKEQIPSLKERDVRMLTCILAGYSMRSVCLLCDIKEGNYYNRWYRLKKRIEKSGAKDVELFRRVINRTPSGKTSDK